jgi:CubicO group peptidase (beta-lactamase class C family)
MPGPSTTKNPDLVVVTDDKPNWNLPQNRRAAFHSLHLIARYGMSIRAPDVLTLVDDEDDRIKQLPSVQELTAMPIFSAMAVVQHQTVRFEAYAPDFGPDRPHSLQSISKTPVHLIIGRLVDDGFVDLSATVASYLPEVGSGYAVASVQQVLDMDVMNNFDEGYADPYRPFPLPANTVGYNTEEIAMGWRLPPPGEPDFSCRDFAAALSSENTVNPTIDTHYRSPNTDILAWIAERVSGRPLRDMLIEIVEAAGIEGVYHISVDRDGVPVIAGGASLTARDLARYGQLFARRGVGVSGQIVGSTAFLETTRDGRGTHITETHDWVRYSNHTYTNGKWIGHAGFAGQFLLVDPDTGISIAFFSVLETQHADEDGYFDKIIGMCEAVAALYDS